MTMEPYLHEYKILSSDTDLCRRLRLSRLFTLLQEAAIAHTEALGFGRSMTLDRGCLWVVTLQEIRILRLPVYDETVRLESVPGETMHTLYPRYYRISDQNGEDLLTAASIWTLIDEKERKMTSPKETGVLIHGIDAPWESFFPRPPKSASDADELRWTVPYSATDLNGHMNNAKYIDLAEDLMPDELRRRRIRQIRAEYACELRLGEELRLCREQRDGSFLLSGHLARRVFRIGLEYEENGDENA